MATALPAKLSPVAGAQELQGDLTVQLRIVRQVDHAHPSARDELHEHVSSQRHPRMKRLNVFRLGRSRLTEYLRSRWLRGCCSVRHSRGWCFRRWLSRRYDFTDPLPPFARYGWTPP